MLDKKADALSMEANTFSRNPQIEEVVTDFDRFRHDPIFRSEYEQWLDMQEREYWRGIDAAAN